MHYAVHGHTAAELIMDRANAEHEHMGLNNWVTNAMLRLLMQFNAKKLLFRNRTLFYEITKSTGYNHLSL